MKFPWVGTAVKMLWVCNLLHTFEIAFSLKLELQENSSVEAHGNGTDDICMQEHPYTFSKCLQICSAHVNPTCLGDSLCVCQSPQDKEPLSRNSTLDAKTTCEKTNYCDVSCRELKASSKSNGGQFFQEGQLCSSSSYSACVCFP